MIEILNNEQFTLSYLSYSKDYYRFVIRINSSNSEHIVDISKHYHLDTIGIALSNYKQVYEVSGLNRDNAIYLAVYGLHDLIDMNQLDTLEQLMTGINNGEYKDIRMDDSLANELEEFLCSLHL